MLFQAREKPYNMRKHRQVERMTNQRRVRITVPSSSANVGLGYDIWCLGLEQPSLKVTAERIPAGIQVEARSPFVPPEGRRLGQAGITALEAFFEAHRIRGGIHLLYEDEGYPVGGLGRSGAEAVGAVLAAAVLHGVRVSRMETIVAAARGEPGEHMDNVAGSANGRFSVIARSPDSGLPSVDVYEVPPDLGIAIGFSSHRKTAGTAGMREALKQPVAPEDFVAQCGLVSAATAALVSGNTNRFLDLVWGDRFHEPRRAAIGGYGSFDAADLAALKRHLFRGFHIALNISGAGPNIQLLYSRKEHPGGIGGAASGVATSWFRERGITLSIQSTCVAPEGAFDRAAREHGLT